MLSRTKENKTTVISIILSVQIQLRTSDEFTKSLSLVDTSEEFFERVYE